MQQSHEFAPAMIVILAINHCFWWPPWFCLAVMVFTSSSEISA